MNKEAKRYLKLALKQKQPEAIKNYIREAMLWENKKD